MVVASMMSPPLEAALVLDHQVTRNVAWLLRARTGQWRHDHAVGKGERSHLDRGTELLRCSCRHVGIVSVANLVLGLMRICMSDGGDVLRLGLAWVSDRG